MPSVSKQTGRAAKNGAPTPGWPEDHLKMLLYGESGSGKTTLWATFPGPILCLLCSGGRSPGELRSVDTTEYRRKITPYAINGVDEIPRALDNAAKYKTIVLDHITGLQDVALRDIIGLDEIPVQKSWGMASQQQYGTCIQQCKEVCRTILNQSANVVIVAQERVFNGKDDNADADGINPTVGAAASPSLAGWINFSCDFVVRMYRRAKMEEQEVKVAGKTTIQKRRGKGVEYALQTEPHDVYMTKFRVPKGHPLPSYIADPDYAKILKVINGG